MTSRYLIRLDDACSTQNRYNWGKIEEVLDKYGIKPIVAVIPDCKDPSMLYDAPLENFWEKVKAWKHKGWTIGMHGYQHVYTELKDKQKSLVPIHNKTEFAGLPYIIQSEKIKRAWDVFLQNNIKPEIWIAPSHTFDLNTLKALEENTEIRIVSDCFAFYPFKYVNFFFVPQQLWKFVKFPFGVWTICLHPNTMTERDFNNLEIWLTRYRENFTNLSEINLENRPWSLFERFINNNLWFNDTIKKRLKIVKKVLR